MQNTQVASVARALAQLQRIFLSFFLVGGLTAGMMVNRVPGGELVLCGATIWAIIGSLWMLVCTYKCASGTGRIGLLWLVLVLVFKLFALIALSWLTRNWLTRKGVKVKNFGLGYELPAEEPIDDSTGFSRF
ncbi:MAG: hypothetical protein J0I12_17830 [Candidatus Eremiobacteraeota bacterium]|nr:hypothetical protein [Candidatus Eremiobacteraeota bacterium]